EHVFDGGGAGGVEKLAALGGAQLAAEDDLALEDVAGGVDDGDLDVVELHPGGCLADRVGGGRGERGHEQVHRGMPAAFPAAGLGQVGLQFAGGGVEHHA